MLAFIADGAFESYRVSVNGVDLNNNEDPYDYVYQNLPDRHHVLRKVPNCLYCGAMRFQYESPGFCCRKGKIKVHVPQVPDELKRLFTSQVDNDAQFSLGWSGEVGRSGVGDPKNIGRRMWSSKERE